MSRLSAFNNQVVNLVNNLSDMFPEDTDLQFTKNSVSLLKKSNPRKLQEMFSQYVSCYRNEINNEESEFFLNRNFVKEDLNLENSHYSNQVMANLKKYWSVIDEESQKNIWKYLKVLLILNDKC